MFLTSVLLSKIQFLHTYILFLRRYNYFIILNIILNWNLNTTLHPDAMCCVYSGNMNISAAIKIQKSYSAMGDFHRVSFKSWPFYCGYRDLVFVTVSESSCMQPCHNMNVVMPYQYGMPTCDICKYFWLDGSRTPSWYHSVPNRTVTLEHLRGEPVATVWVSSETDVKAGGHILSYNLSQFTHRFEKKRLFRVEMTGGSLWRVHKDALSKVYMIEGGSSDLGPRGEVDIGVLQRRGSYEYTIVSNMREYYPTAYDVWCGLHGASLLTIHDDQELSFVVNQIMLPLRIEYIFIKIGRPISHI